MAGMGYGQQRLEAVGDRPERALEAFERRVSQNTDRIRGISGKLEGEADRIHNEGAIPEARNLKDSAGGAPSAPGTIQSVSSALSSLEDALDRLEKQAGRFDTI